MKFLSLIILLFVFQTSSFKENQLRYPRVREAYNDKQESIQSLLQTKNIVFSELEVYLRVFKKEKILELWGKSIKDENFILLKEYNICRTSGTLGPKRRQGDFQIPEGFYYIDRFNPASNFHLSMGINYPNPADKILGVKGNLGGDIFLHGSCVTIGCVPITDDFIKELYVYCVEAKNNGQEKISVSIFPTKLNDKNYENLINCRSINDDCRNLWADLKVLYNGFDKYKVIPSVKFLKTGRMLFSFN